MPFAGGATAVVDVAAAAGGAAGFAAAVAGGAAAGAAVTGAAVTGAAAAVVGAVAAGLAGEPTVTSGVISAMVFAGTPAFDRSATAAYGRPAMIFLAVAGPTPGSPSRSFWLAALRSTGPLGAPALAARESVLAEG